MPLPRVFESRRAFPSPVPLLLVLLLVLLDAAAPVSAMIRVRVSAPKKPPTTSPTCDLCRDNWLFVLGAGGRTGTTTAMAMLDAIPGIEIAGEHDALLEDERRLYQKLLDLQHRVGAAWKHRPLDKHYIKCSIQERTKRIVFGSRYDSMHKATKVFGFKEIRYLTLGMLKFIDEIFPCARYVFTYRKNTNVAVRAKIFGQNFTRTWAAHRDLFKVVHGAFRDRTRMLAVENLNPREFTSVLQDLVGAKGCSYNRLVHSNSNGGYTDGKELRGITKSLVRGRCDLSDVSFRLPPEALDESLARWEYVRKTMAKNGTRAR